MIGNDRVEVRKTHKLFVGGAFPRSESGRTYEATNSQGEFLANVAMPVEKMPAMPSSQRARVSTHGQKPRPTTGGKFFTESPR